MPNLIIDNRPIEVPEGTKVIEAAARLGIMIPRFCYHPALGSVGACRVCAVKVLESPTCKGLQMSCMIEAAEGMVVSTTDGEVVDFRRQVIEWLMANHPHDCPVCDEGGHCLLQDMTVSGGHGLRRFPGKKRTHRDQDLGPLVVHEMNRCIQCYRCTRYYREVSGYPDLGVTGIGGRVYFGRRTNGTLESPFAGNLIDICPTGVYTDKPARYKGRRWDLERGPSLCINCSLGCGVTTGARYREVVRLEARLNPSVNGHFICDRGRYGFYYSNAADRPRSGRVAGKHVPVRTSTEAAARRLSKIAAESGHKAVAVAGSVRSTLETLAALKHCCQSKKWTGPTFFPDLKTALNTDTAVSRLGPDLAVSLAAIAQHDMIVVVGADPVNEAPMLAMALRQAQRNGASVVVIDPRPVELPLTFRHIPAAPDTLCDCLGAVLKNALNTEMANAVDGPARRSCENLPDRVPEHDGPIAETARALIRCRRPVFVCGTDIPSRDVISLVADAAVLTAPAKDRTGLFYLMPGANAVGAALVSGEPAGFDGIVEGIENGTVRALILVENDPFCYYPDRQRLKRALERLDLLVVADYLNSEAGQMADVFVPTTTVFETGGRFINQEGRLQTAGPTFKGGMPVTQASGGDHPPRSFRQDIPGGDALPAGDIVAALALDVGAKAGDRPDTACRAGLAGVHPAIEKVLTAADDHGEGVRLEFDGFAPAPFTGNSPAAAEKPDGAYRLVLCEQTFGTEALSRYSACLQKREDAPTLALHREDAAVLGLATGDTAVIETEGGSICIPVRLTEKMAKGVLVLPRHRQIAWQRFGKEPIWLSKDHIRKASGDKTC